MKNHLIISLLLLSVGFCQQEYNANNLNEIDGVFYTTDTNEPYSGTVFSLYENGNKESEWTLKNGRKDGLYTYWYDNGQKSSEGTYKDGKEDGLWTGWYDNGQKEIEGTFKDGKPDGLSTLWYENGQKRQEGTENEWTYWNEDGSLKE